jgi:hypothetical protein
VVTLELPACGLVGAISNAGELIVKSHETHGLWGRDAAAPFVLLDKDTTFVVTARAGTERGTFITTAAAGVRLNRAVWVNASREGYSLVRDRVVKCTANPGPVLSVWTAADWIDSSARYGGELN